MSCLNVSVLLAHASVLDRTKLIYAMLDLDSDASFVLDKTLESFNVSSLDVNSSVSTLTGVNQQVLSRKCYGFKVQGLDMSEVS